MEWALVRVPASSANLGPGFDALGLALDLHLEVRFRLSGSLAIRVEGVGADQIPRDETNFILRTAAEVAERAGQQLPPLDMEIRNEIPLGKGLGSSAAAATAGVVIARHLMGFDWDLEPLLEESSRIEGHPDNAAACILGGVVAASSEDDGRVTAIRFELPDGCEVAAVVPETALATSEARAALPALYSRQDVVFNLQRVAVLTAAMASGCVEAMQDAFGDRVHQPYRCALVPGLREILDLRAPGLLGCVLSGAGPTILVFYRSARREVCRQVAHILSNHDVRATVLDAGWCKTGVLLATGRSVGD